MWTRGEGVKNPENFADVLYVWSHRNHFLSVDSILFDQIYLLHWRSDVSERFLIGGSATIYLSGLSGIEFPFWNSAALAAALMYTLDRAMPQLGAELHQTTFSVQEKSLFLPIPNPAAEEHRVT